MLLSALTVTSMGITTKGNLGQRRPRGKRKPAAALTRRAIHHVRGDARETSFVVARPIRNASRINYPQMHKSAALPLA